jgi:hypothetical protein
MEIDMNIDTSKSYATEENLMKALEKAGLDKCKPLVVRNREGRYTAIFGYAIYGVQNPFIIAHKGFMVIN